MIYRAKDLWEAAYLMTEGFTPHGTEAVGKWVNFTFDDGDGRISAAATRYLGNPSVRLGDFRHCYEMLSKTIMTMRDLAFPARSG